MSSEYFDSTDFENDNINKRFSNKNEKERKQKEKRSENRYFCRFWGWKINTYGNDCKRL